LVVHRADPRIRARIDLVVAARTGESAKTRRQAYSDSTHPPPSTCLTLPRGNLQASIRPRPGGMRRLSATTSSRRPSTCASRALARRASPTAPLAAQPTLPGVCTVLRRRLLAAAP